MRRPSTRLDRTADIVRRTRLLVRKMGLTAEGLRDELNHKYLHPQDGVSVSTVVKWLSWPIAQMKSESFAALQNWIADQDKPTNKK